MACVLGPVWLTVILACLVLYGASVARALAGPSASWRLAWSLAEAPDALVELGALAPGRVWVDGQWWRVVTAGFLHGSVLHLGVNLWSLAAVAPWLDRAVGRPASLAIFLAGEVAGALASLAHVEAAVVVGASAGILAQAGALWLLRRHGPPAMRARIFEVRPGPLLGSLLVLVALGAVVPVIAQAGHLGGLTLGLSAVAPVAVPRLRPRARLLAPVIAMFVLVGLFAAARAPWWSAAYYQARGLRELRLERWEPAARDLDRALALAPDDPVAMNAVAYALALAGRDLDRAIDLAERALAADPENVDVLDTLGWALCRAGRAREGRVWLERARTLADPVFPELVDHLATCEAAAVTPGGGGEAP